MSLLGESLIGLARSAAIAFAALWTARHLLPLILPPGGGRALRWGWLTVIALPWITPPLLVGYVWAKSHPWWIGLPVWTELFYALALFLRFTPCAVAALWLFPPSIDSRGRHLLEQASPSGSRKWGIRIRQAHDDWGRAWTLTTLLIFSDFELAAMWNPRQWTVFLFDQHTGGLPITESWRLALAPSAIQGLLLLVCGLHRRVKDLGTRPFLPPLLVSAKWYACVALVLTTIGPLAWLAFQTPAAFGNLPALAQMLPDLSTSLQLTGASAALAFGAARLTALHPRISLMGAFPGLFGPLVLGLTLLHAFSWPQIAHLRQTMLPAITGLTLVLFPVAWLLAAALHRRESTPAAFLATAHPQLRWSLLQRPAFLAFGLLFCLGWFDFTTSSLLSPPGVFPVFARLHNLVHYGRSDLLSTMLLAACLSPLLIIAAGLGIGHLWVHAIRRGTR